MQRAIIIARVSTKEQAEEGYSLDAQVKLLRGYKKTGDFRIVKEFTIPETASKEQERRLFNEAIKLAGTKTKRRLKAIQNNLTGDTIIFEKGKRII